MKNVVKNILPHILFLLLTLLIFSPSIEGTEKPFCFYAVCVFVEVLLLLYRKRSATPYIVSIVYLFLIIWEFSCSIHGAKNVVLFPPPENVFAVLPDNYDKILQGILSSLGLLGKAFGFALFFGVLLGFIVGLSDQLTAIVMPIVKVISPIPPLIYSPYAVALLPSFHAAAVFIVAITIFWSLFMSVVLSIRQIDPKIMDSARTLNLNKASLITHVLLPYSLPGIFNNLTVSLSTSFLVLTAAEMIGASSGLGWYIKYHSDFANYAKVIFGIIVIGVVVTLLNKMILAVRKICIRWR